MAVVIASDLAKDMAGEPLLRGVSFKLERRDRLALSGRNGSGKTTLMRMLAGETSIDGGELHVAKGVRLALHDQRPPRELDLSLRDYILTGCADLVALEGELAALEAAMAEGDVSEATFDAYGRAQTRLEHAGGYGWREQAMASVRGLGLREEQLDQPLASLSGGELTRGSLARALAGDPDLLLLDEPTNHLDIASLEWLESKLKSLDAAVVLVAHDRWFLEEVGTAVLELEAGRAKFFAGTWHAWRKEKAARETALGRAIEKQAAEIAQLERFVARFRAGTKAKQAQSRVKKLEKIEKLARDPKDGAALGFAFKPPERSGRVVYELEDATVAIGDKVLLHRAELWLERGEHVSLVGANGSGKTTLISVLTGRRELAAGKLRSGHNVKVGHLSQHAEELEGPAHTTVLESCQHRTGLKPNEARALLGRFLFSGDAVDKRVADLSGGERQRLSLACLVAGGANVLVLDEPTNHLDVESREALESALQGFAGSVLLVTHDRALLDAVGTRTIAVEDGTLRSYVGGWPEYVRVREERAAHVRQAKSAAAAQRHKPAVKAANGAGAGRRADPKAVRRAESEVEAAEAALAAVEAELAEPGAWAGERARESTRRHAEAKRAVEEAYARYEALEV